MIRKLFLLPDKSVSTAVAATITTITSTAAANSTLYNNFTSNIAAATVAVANTLYNGIYCILIFDFINLTES